jgi:large repetitive protein
MRNRILHATFSLFLLTSVFSSYSFGEPLVPALSASFVKTNVSVCGNGHDGTISLSITGGSEPYSYSWTGSNNFSSNAANLADLNRGFYNVTITDADLNTVSISNIQIAFAFAVYVTNNGGITSVCGNTGSIILYGNAGVLPYSYSIDGINYQATNTFTGLPAGTYIGHVKDAAGCVSTKSIVIGSALPLVVAPFVRTASRCYDDGMIEIYRTGGTGPYSYSLDGINYQTSNRFQNLPAGVYTTWVMDAKGCVAATEASVTKIPPIVINPTITPTSTCVENGTIKIEVSGSTEQFNYSIDGLHYYSKNIFTGLGTSSYDLSVRDNKGCAGMLTVDVLETYVEVAVSKVDATQCYTIDGSITIDATGGYGPYTYSVDGFNFQESNHFVDISSGNYYCYVMDSQGCIGMYEGLPVGPFNCSPERTARQKTISKADPAVSITTFPNPSASEFNLKLNNFNQNEKVRITVTDVLGKRVYVADGINEKVYTFGNNFKPGVYMVEVVQGNTRKNAQVIRQ